MSHDSPDSRSTPLDARSRRLREPHRAVFLDRDGVINQCELRTGKPHPPATLADLKVLPGVPQSLSRLRQAGYLTIVVTNQPDVAKGIQQRDIVEAMHARLARELPLDAFYVCYHVDDDGCSCRKPRPGMLLQAAADWHIDLARSWMVGDRWRDVGAGRAAGSRTVWIDRDYAERGAESPDWTCRSLPEATEIILCPAPDAASDLSSRNGIR